MLDTGDRRRGVPAGRVDHGDDARPLDSGWTLLRADAVRVSNHQDRSAARTPRAPTQLPTGLAPPRPSAAGGTPPSSWRLGALLSSDDCRSSVERAAHGQVLWGARSWADSVLSEVFVVAAWHALERADQIAVCDPGSDLVRQATRPWPASRPASASSAPTDLGDDLIDTCGLRSRSTRAPTWPDTASWRSAGNQGAKRGVTGEPRLATIPLERATALQ